MTARKSSQDMKPATAAKKLDIYLPATPAEFQDGFISREELTTLQNDPPEWLQELRQNGPHPRSVVAARLGVSISGLARAGVSDALTSDDIDAIRDEDPDWLEHERGIQADVRAEEARLKDEKAKKRPRS
ncbi:hypothetical protein E1263_37060 [Kribbella antibiotica]|uniref:Uncharacterized protein n=1 Tax=Kribbella antibiotica TaxID=190195 RepID=A0A4R4YNS3_9ACTN|nr:DUF5997 family protein [Kribbella antibiotica]TDD46200.1 hypothetical protein E1263_37060 [Kribbella antibiotica]